MINNQPIPDTDSVLRHCSGQELDDDGWPMAAAFEPRLDKGETELSVNWLQFFQFATFDEQLDALRSELAQVRKVKPSHRLAQLIVGTSKQYVQQHSHDGRVLRFLHRPRNDDSHSEIFDVTPGHKVIARLLANTVVNHFSAKVRS